MTESEIIQAEKDAREDAESLMLMVLLASSVVFRADVGRFYVNDRSVSINQVRAYLNRIERRMGARLIKLTDELAKGKITVREWQKGLERNLTSAHILAGALAIGTIKAAVRNGNLQERIRQEMLRTDDLARRVKEGTAGTQSRMRGRMTFYLTSVAVTYGVLEQLVRNTVGEQSECRRIRRASESCSGCIAYAYKWMPIGEMPPIGSLNCGSWCRCYLEYR